MDRRRFRGRFITLEGPEGSGKSTQAFYLAGMLKKHGYSVLQTREPGGTPLAEAIRQLLLSSPTRESVRAHTEALLILAARSQHVTHVIMPALRQGMIVLCDRFADSTFAYQGHGRNISLPWLKQMNEAATDGLVPDLTLLFDLPVSIGLARRRNARGKQNRLDRESERFHRKVRRGFLMLARQNRKRIVVIDAKQRPDAIAALAQNLVLKHLKHHRLSRKRS
ncbi:MAG TPA: dTMP kinase [Nitrospiraceae bacterium]